MSCPWYDSVPLQPTEKPGVGLAPSSHCHWLVGGVRIPGETSASSDGRHGKRRMLTATTLAVGETALSVDTVLVDWQALVTDPVLPVLEMSDLEWAAWTAVGCKLEAAVSQSQQVHREVRRVR